MIPPDLSLRHALLLALTAGPSSAARASIITCADAADRPEIARLFTAVAAIRSGHAPQEAGTGMTHARAVEDLAALMTVIGGAPSIVASPGSAGSVLPSTDVFGLIEALAAALDRRSDDPGGALDRLHAATPPPIAGATAPIMDLAAHVALVDMRHFLRVHHDLALAPLGSLRLLCETAALGLPLGRYFSNVPAIAPTGRAIIDLAAGALDKTDLQATPAVLARWVNLLAVHLDRAGRLSLIDAIGDRDMVDATRCQLAIEERRRADHQDPEILWRLRDVGLDLGDLDLAVGSQRMVAERDNAPVEWIVLGEVLASGGRLEAAEQAFLRGLQARPDVAEWQARLSAVRAGDYTRFMVKGGFGSSSYRKAVRAVRIRTRPARPDRKAA